MSRPRAVGMAWYERGSWAEVRGIMADADRLPATYETWLVSAEQVEAEVVRSGVRVVRVTIEPGPFADWCTARGRPRDGAARAEFVTTHDGRGENAATGEAGTTLANGENPCSDAR